MQTGRRPIAGARYCQTE